jgi:acyl-CoA synthetase (NDP forming)
VAPGSAADARLKQALLAPRSVALVGASGDPAKNTARPQRFLRKHGFTGRIFPINPSRSEVLGEVAYKDLSSVPESIDHAFIMVEQVEEALEQCGRRGIPVASVYSNGFADAGAEGAARQRRLVARAKALGVRLLGPNSMGVVNLAGRVALTVNAVLEMDAPPVGGASLISQSGTMLGTMLSRGAARGLGFSKLISVGNEADLGVGELVAMLAEDAQTRVILLFLETVRDAPRLADAARKAHAAGKPVVAYKLGRSAQGEALARSHTGALAGNDKALDAFFRDCGILRVDMLETLVEIAPLVAERRPPDLHRPARVSVVTTTGGGAASVVDRLGLAGIETVAPGSDAPIFDLTMTATPEVYRKTLEKLLAAPECDAVLAAVGSSAQFHPALAVQPILAAPRGEKPLAAFLTPHAEASLALLAKSEVPAFRTPEACADAFRAFFSWKSPRERESFEHKAFTGDAFQLLRSLGIPVVEQQIARAPDFSHTVPYPVAVKVTDVAHKTEAGGVVLGVSDGKAFQREGRRLNRKQLLVQRMETGLAEAIVGYRDDPVAGPIVLVGAGGVLSEIYGDVAIRMAPVSEREAEEMIAEVKGLAVIRGYRNLPKGDIEALARVVSAFSRAVSFQNIQEAEINPVIVKSSGVVAVDALMVLKA